MLEAQPCFHSYCARFPSEVAEAAIKDYSKKCDGVLGPFCGRGTTLVARLAFGRSVVGADVDTLAGMWKEVSGHRGWGRILQSNGVATAEDSHFVCRLRPTSRRTYGSPRSLIDSVLYSGRDFL